MAVIEAELARFEQPLASIEPGRSRSFTPPRPRMDEVPARPSEQEGLSIATRRLAGPARTRRVRQRRQHRGLCRRQPVADGLLPASSVRHRGRAALVPGPLVMCDVGANIRAQAGPSCRTASWPAPTPPRFGPRQGPRRAPVRRQEDLKGTPSSSTPRLCCALRPHQLRGNTQRRGTRPVPRELRRRHLRRLRGTIALSDEVSPRPVKTSRRKSPWPARAGRKLKPSSNASGQPRLRRVRWGPVVGVNGVASSVTAAVRMLRSVTRSGSPPTIWIVI